MLYNICCITSKQAWDQFYVTKFILYNKKSYAIYDISTFQMLIGSWRGFSGRTAGHNCWTLIISLASLAALLGSWCAAQSGQKKLTVWTCHWWAQLLMQVKVDCSPGLALDGCNHKKVLNSHCLKQTERHFSVCSFLRHCSVGWLLPWPADQHDADDSTCSMPISCNQAKVGCSRNNATDSHAWCSPGLQ